MGRPRTVLITACLNGARERGEHPLLPVTADELAADALAAVRAGAGAIHVHPRGPGGAESLDPEVCGRAVEAIRSAVPGRPVGLSTADWIAPHPERLDLIRSWRSLPDACSVNFSEPGAVELCELLWSMGIGVEAGIGDLADAEVLLASGLADRCRRILVEVDDGPGAAAEAGAIGSALAEIPTPQLHHGFGRSTWVVIERAIRQGHDVRVGLEDTLVLAGGGPAESNAHLVTEVGRML